MVHYTKDQVQVKVGEYDFNMAEETMDKVYTIKRIVIHENYNPHTDENDIAIIQLRFV